MRCPKCGYISFDRQKACGKCSNDLTAVAAQLQGTVGKAAAPFFLGAILREEQACAAEPEPSHGEAEELLILDEQTTQALSADQDDFVLVEGPLAEVALEDQPLPGLDLGNINVSDLESLQTEEAGSENLAEQTDDLEIMLTEPPVKVEGEDNVDYSSLLNFEETEEMPEENEEIHDIFELCLEGGKIPAPTVEVKKPVSLGTDIPDLGLMLEKDDQ